MTKRVMKLLFLLCLVMATVNSYCQTDPNDRLALVDLYNSTNGSGWTDKTNWLTANDPSTWFGVTVTGTRVTSIDLSDNALSGTLPASIANLDNLQQLNLSQNNLTGTIPAVPNYPQLNLLDLSDNQFTGPLPPTVLNLGNLVELNLSQNQISGTVSSAIAGLLSIQILDLSFNQLGGSLPEALYSLASLNQLLLNNNSFSGDLPKTVKSLVNLQILRLQNNHLDSGIPRELEQLTNLSDLNLSSNKFHRMEKLTALFNDAAVTVAVENNRLQFDDIDNNFGAGKLVHFTYIPQDSVNSNKVITLFEDDDFSATANVRGSANIYDWHKNGTGGQGSSATITRTSVSLEAGDQGKYYCVVTDGNGSGLTLITRTITLKLLSCDSPIDPQDLAALVALYNSTDGPHWANHDNWLVPGQDPSTWFGVTMQCQRVTALNIINNNLNGTIPPEIGNLTDLRELQLSSNNLSGGIPPSIGNLRSLDKLLLEENQLTAPLPPELGKLTLITLLRLNDNKITGPLPDEIGNLRDLTDLRLWNNKMTGPISMLTTLDAITSLYLEDNKFSGHLPEAITDLSNLVILDVGRNQLTGTLPIGWNKLPNFEELGLGANHFYGTIPSTITSMLQLSFLSISYDSLTGTIPANIGDLTNIQLLDFSGNFFDNHTFPSSLNTCLQLQSLGLRANNMDGPIPAFVGSFSHLTSLDCGYNNLTGGVPAVLGSLPTLISLDLSYNTLTGSIPASLGNLTNLSHLDIQHNLLAGPVPSSFGGLTSVKELWLNNNQLAGSIPVELGNLANVTDLRLNDNRLTGTIPPALGSAAKLAWLYLSNNQLTGSIPKELGNLPKLEILFLTDNQLTGGLPPELGNCPNMADLVVNGNQLAGKIPSTYSNFKKLFWLDLSANAFTDSIPGFFSANTGLYYLILTNNKFTYVPNFTSAMPQLIGVSLGNNKLGFESIEPYFQAKSQYTLFFDYTPQDSSGVATNPVIRGGCPTTLKANVAGSHNIYQWYKNGIVIPSATGTTLPFAAIASSDAGAYTVQVTNTLVTGISIGVRRTKIAVNPAVNTLLAENPANQLCNVKHLFATPSGLFAYQWYLDGKKIVGATTDKYDAFYSGNYTVTYTPDATSCSLSTPVLATTGLYADPPPAITSTGSPVTKLSTTYVAASYQWFVNDKFIANEKANELPVFYNGSYYLVAILANNCQYRSNTITVNENKYTSLARIAGTEGDTVRIEAPQDLIRIFPNPVRDVVQIDFGSFKAMGIEFYDNNSKLVFRKELDGAVSIVQIDVSNWAPGIYITSIWSDEKRIWRKLVK